MKRTQRFTVILGLASLASWCVAVGFSGCGTGDEVRESFKLTISVPPDAASSGELSFDKKFTFQTNNAASAAGVFIENVFLTLPNQPNDDLTVLKSFELSVMRGRGVIPIAARDDFAAKDQVVKLESVLAEDARRLIDDDNSVMLRATLAVDPAYSIPPEGLELLVLTSVFVER